MDANQAGEEKLSVLEALERCWNGDTTNWSFDPGEAVHHVSGAAEGEISVGTGAMDSDKLLTIEVKIPHTGIASGAQSGQGEPIRQADQFFSYIRDVFAKADVGLDESEQEIQQDSAEEGIAATKHNYYFGSSNEGLSFEAALHIRIHPQDVEKVHEALQQEIAQTKALLVPGEVPHASVTSPNAAGKLEPSAITPEV